MKKVSRGRALQYALIFFAAASLASCNPNAFIAGSLDSPTNSPKEQEILKTVSQQSKPATVANPGEYVGPLCLGPWKDRVQGAQVSKVVYETQATDAQYQWADVNLGGDWVSGFVPVGADLAGSFTAKSFLKVFTPTAMGCQVAEDVYEAKSLYYLVLAPTNLSIGQAPALKSQVTDDPPVKWTGAKQKVP